MSADCSLAMTSTVGSPVVDTIPCCRTGSSSAFRFIDASLRCERFYSRRAKLFGLAVAGQIHPSAPSA